MRFLASEIRHKTVSLLLIPYLAYSIRNLFVLCVQCKCRPTSNSNVCCFFLVSYRILVAFVSCLLNFFFVLSCLLISFLARTSILSYFSCWTVQLEDKKRCNHVSYSETRLATRIFISFHGCKIIRESIHLNKMVRIKSLTRENFLLTIGSNWVRQFEEKLSTKFVLY